MSVPSIVTPEMFDPSQGAYDLASAFLLGIPQATRRDKRNIWDVRVDYCRQYLSDLDNTSRWMEYTADQLAVARVTALREQSLWSSFHDTELQRPLLEEVLATAKASGSAIAIHEAYNALGRFYQLEELFEEAAWHFRESLLYAYALGPTGMAAPLIQLGEVLAMREETLREAVLVLNWAGRFGPGYFQARVLAAKYRCQLGEQEALKTWVATAQPQTSDEIADVIAVLLALGRRTKALAHWREQGRLRAEAEGNLDWRLFFAHQMAEVGK